MVRSDWAPAATASAAWITPLLTIPGGKPVTAVPGLTPTSPLMTEGPVLVTVDPARTAKLSAVPRPTVGSAAAAGPTPTTVIVSATAVTTLTAARRILRGERPSRGGMGR